MTKRVAVLTDFAYFMDSYSLSHVVTDQLVMLIRGGYRPVLFVREDWTGGRSLELPGGYQCEVLPAFPAQPDAARIAERLLEILPNFPVAFTHDWIHLARLQPYADALSKIASLTRSTRFFHWIHSVPTMRRLWWDMGQYADNHYLVYGNETDREAVCKQFRADLDQRLIVPPPVDLRTMFGYHEGVWRIIDAIPGIVSADFVQIYPAAADRLKDKGVDKLIPLFAAIKRTRHSTCLLVVDGWTTRHPRNDKDRYRTMAESCGLTDTEFVFLSDVIPDFTGMPRTWLCQLQQWANLFVFPTMGESFGLCLPEAILAGGAYPVINGSLPMLEETVGPGCDCRPEFGSCEKRAPKRNEREFYDLTAQEILRGFQGDKNVSRRDWQRKNRNLDITFERYYKPILEV